MSKTSKKTKETAAPACYLQVPDDAIVRLAWRDLVPHPANRRFDTEGSDLWESLKRSIATHGILTPLRVRPVGEPKEGKYQLLAGHRRWVAAGSVGLTHLPCLVSEMSDTEAGEYVLMENLHRQDLSVCDEALAIDWLVEECQLTPEQVAQAISRTETWVRARQLLLELPQEAFDALELPKDDPGHLTLAAAQEILAVPAEYREEAVQMVLHPSMEEGTLNAHQAHDVLQRCLVRPMQQRAEWERVREAAEKAWEKSFKKEYGDFAKGCFRSMDYLESAQVMRTHHPAAELVPAVELSDHAPQGLIWAQLAVRHGLLLKVVYHPEAAEGSSVWVDANLLRQAEQAWAESGEEAWLITRRVGAPSRDARVVAAERELDGEPAGDDGDETPGQTVIEQRMERTAWCDLTPVHDLLARAEKANQEAGVVWLTNDPCYPEWARNMPADHVEDVCNWVLSLAKSAGTVAAISSEAVAEFIKAGMVEGGAL